MYPMSNYKFSKNMFCNLQFVIQFIKPTIIIRKISLEKNSNNISIMQHVVLVTDVYGYFLYVLVIKYKHKILSGQVPFIFLKTE